MHLDAVPEEGRSLYAPPPLSGMTRFAPSERGSDAERELRARRFLWACAPATVPEGRLRVVLDEAVEMALALRGALPPEVEPGASLDTVIADQVFRAMALGAAGIAIALPRLGGGARGALHPDDSATLVAWLSAAREAPIALVFDEGDRRVPVLAPVPLAELVERTTSGGPPPDSRERARGLALCEPERSPEAAQPHAQANAAREAPSTCESAAAHDAATERETAATRETAASHEAATARGAAAARENDAAAAYKAAATHEPAPAHDAAAARETPAAHDTAAARETPAAHDTAAARETPAAHDTAAAREAREAPPPARPSLSAPPAEGRADGRPRGVLLPRSSRLRRPDAAAGAPPAPSARAAASTDAPPAADAGAAVALPGTAPAAPPGVAVATPLRGALEAAAAAQPGDAHAGPDAQPEGRRERKVPRGRTLNAAEWRVLAAELDGARGPKPVRVIEQLFATHYTPLLGATLSGEADMTVRNVVDNWRTSFEHSYREAFSALRVTGKRPPMVFDAPDIAARIGRLNGARGVKLLLVDAMRFDLGERVAAHLKEILLDRAILVERSLLWAALPPTTTAQLSLIARGPDGLREATPPVEAEPAIARGRAVATLRRERVGTRELMKLDLVEARLRTAGPAFAERIEGIAEEVADVIARFMASLPPRTLLLVFGDHGFRLTPMGDGSTTGPATQGGGSPEEVLVPAQAWLVGGVH